ncbi:MAG: NigD-like protein [Bacteroidales bacterium]|jgi:hypothetical protein|nr:NigD-like protein [Bacteroidales bacterium]
MKTIIKLLLLPAIISLFAVACNDDDDDPDTMYISIATVENPENKSTFFFKLDQSQGRMLTAETLLPNYRPKDGQRIVATYSLLSDKSSEGEYDYDVRLYRVYSILTKEIFEITPETQDSIGNDKIGINDIWISADYVNVEFMYRGFNKAHFINLVSDDSEVYDDGKIHLEFRHNANDDSPLQNKWGLASFDLAPFLEDGSGQLIFVIHTKEYDTDEKTYELLYNSGSSSNEEKTFTWDEENEGDIG